MERRWIDLEGLDNLRDVGGIPTTDGGTIAAGRLFRSENLQSLSEADIDALLALGLTDVVDLRSDFEVEAAGPGPITGRAEVTVHQHSFFKEWREGVGEDKPDVRPEVLPEEALPWVDLTPSVELDHPLASHYMSYLVDRPDSVVAALRDIATAPGVVLVHCAAGKDRTGTLVALALLVADADTEAVVADYAASTERAAAVVARLLASPVYSETLRDRTIESHYSLPETMISFLDHVRAEYGGVRPLLGRIGLTDAELDALRAKLRS